MTAMMNPHLRPVGLSEGHASLVRDLLSAFTEQDRHTIERLIAVDCVWRVPGRGPLAGEYVGHDAVIGLFRHLRRVFDTPARFEVLDIATSDDRAICFQYGVAQVGGTPIRLKECLVFRIEDGQFIEVDEFQFDQEVFDEVFVGHARRIAEGGQA